MSDVVVIGGGVIGLSAASELASRGLSVTVLDQQQPGCEASWAGAGILPPGRAGELNHPLAQLSRATHALWPELSRQLLDETGIDNGFRQCGGLCFSPDTDQTSLQREIDDWNSAGIAVETPSLVELRQREPALGTATGPGYRLPDTWQVRNPRHLKALLSACVRRGVDIQSGQNAVEFELNHGRAHAVKTPSGRHPAGAFLVAAGAWSQRLAAPLGCRRDIEPVRGQMLLLSTPAPLFNHIIECGLRYLVPRPDGRTLVGSTEEWVGFEKCNTPVATRNLMDFALRMVPGLADARFESAWSGLRPHSRDGLPLLGRLPAAGNLFIAAGHFRAGLHLSPITGRLMSQLISDEPTDMDLAPFAPDSG